MNLSKKILITMGIVCLPYTVLADEYVEATEDISNQKNSKGLLEDSKLKVTSRTMYMNNNARKGGFYSAGGYAKRPKDRGTAEDFGTGLLGKYESGFTQGTVGVGLDIMGMTAVKFDSGRGRYGDDTNSFFPADGRSGKAQDNYSKVAVAVKARISKTELKYGQMQVDTPIFATDLENRLLPEDATGFMVVSEELQGLVVKAGYFTALRAQEYARRDSITSDSMYFNNGATLRGVYLAGLEYQFNDQLSGKFYASRNKDFWKKYYTNLNYGYQINNDNSLGVDFNWYQTKSIGKGYGDELRANNSNRRINSDLWSIAAAYTYKAHTVTLAYQRNSGTGSLGRTGFPYGVDGGKAIAVANSVQYSDFNFENQHSWQMRYDLDFESYGVPGLVFTALYVKADNATNESQGYRHNGKAWERDLYLTYTVPEGKAKDLSFIIRYASYRSNFGGGTDNSVNGLHNANGRDNKDQLRVIMQYPLSIL